MPYEVSSIISPNGVSSKEDCTCWETATEAESLMSSRYVASSTDDFTSLETEPGSYQPRTTAQVNYDSPLEGEMSEAEAECVSKRKKRLLTKDRSATRAAQRMLRCTGFSEGHIRNASHPANTVSLCTVSDGSASTTADEEPDQRSLVTPQRSSLSVVDDVASIIPHYKMCTKINPRTVLERITSKDKPRKAKRMQKKQQKKHSRAELKWTTVLDEQEVWAEIRDVAVEALRRW